MKKRHKPIRTPVMRGEANYYLSQLYHISDAAKKLGQLLWRHGFRAGVRAARKQIYEGAKECRSKK